jgi:hypothetical protein
MLVERDTTPLAIFHVHPPHLILHAPLLQMLSTIRTLVRRSGETIRSRFIIRRSLAHLDFLIIADHPLLLALGGVAVQLLFISIFGTLRLVLRGCWELLVGSRGSWGLGARDVVVGGVLVVVLRATTHCIAVALLAEMVSVIVSGMSDLDNCRRKELTR